MDFRSETFEIASAIRLLLQEEKQPLFASAEDCAYFRQFYRPKKPLAAPPPPLTASVKPSPQPPLAESKKKETPLPSAPQKRAFPQEKVQEEVSFRDLRALVEKVAPRWTLLDDLLDDREARLFAEKWKTNCQIAPVMIFFFKETQEERLFLENVSKALGAEARLLPAQQFEQANQWRSILGEKEIKLAILSAPALKQLPNLLKCFRENSSGRFLLKTPLLLLPEINTFLQNPLSKRPLWDELKKYASRS